ncbi:MAG: hypothetical protein F6K61_04505 [Sphaerospermopsis sp. SIO1G1]|nr:hypothetical protein [Sphaerospermopsis sp. SIO1G1]
MNTNTFDNNYVTCPICQRSSRIKPVKTYIGLFTCPYCQEKLVVCKSGHYVRDPFTWKTIMISSALRRQSRPLARILRELVLLRRSLFALGIGLGILLTTITITQESTSFNQELFPSHEKIQK